MRKGFTLLEILLVIAAIGILAAIVIIAINPTRQLAQVRNTTRTSDVNTLSKGLDQYLIDQGGYPSSITGSPQEICAQDAADCTGLLDIQSELVPDYMASIPQDPQTTGNGSGYEVSINSTNGKVSVNAISSELEQTIAINAEPVSALSDTVVSVGNGAFNFANAIATDSNGDVYAFGSFSGTLDFGGSVGNVTSNGSGDAFLAKYNSAGEVQWATNYGGTGLESVSDMIVDNSGNVYISGGFGNSITIGLDTYTATGTFDGFLIKIDTNGSVIWSKQLEGPSGGSQFFRSMAVDASDNVYVAASFAEDARLDGTTFTNSHTALQDSLIMQLNPAGVLQWSDQIQGDGDELILSLDHDPNGNVVIVGRYGNTVSGPNVNLGTAGTVTAFGGYDTFIVQYTDAGVHQWTESFTDSQNVTGEDIVIDDNGEIFIGGIFIDNPDFGAIGSPITRAGNNQDGYLIGLNSSGVSQWITHVTGSSSESVDNLVIDRAEDRIYATGTFNGNNLEIGGLPAEVAQGGEDAYVAQFTTAGTATNARYYQGAGTMIGSGSAIDSQNNYFSVVSFGGVADFGPAGSVSGSAGFDIGIVFSPAF